MLTPVMKHNLQELVLVMTKIISFSLLSGIAPDTFEHVTVTPLLTKAGLDVIESKMQTGL